MISSGRARSLWILTLCVAGPACSDSGSLTRQRAKELLEQHPKFQRIEVSIFRQQPIPLSSDIVALEAKGLVTVVQKAGAMGRMVEPTAAAKGLISSDDRFTFVLNVCSRTVVDMTRIDVHKDGKSAAAHFTYAIAESSPLAGKIPSCTVKAGAEGLSSYRRFDDGWRLVESSPPLNR